MQMLRKVRSTLCQPNQPLDKAGKVEIYDAAGKAIVFKSLYNAEPGEHKRVMVIFIRHFFCGVGRSYPCCHSCS
jgi:hypothetical protein